eukprot:TRINITY_DN1109_c0_g1::TRINITY_DN1109_c0_g1_i1::g.17293::m.17293 TRINITY_DN1109_c0_g1::TRINITY_DN1109_c0_g1_i1::g.17293  ORF type:complete len:509 (+),score=116.49,sp/Q9FG01/ATO_ARATH/37.29/6e-98,DUF3449/PF11931.3/2.3e+03,DUF3449/PF11931.3/1.2e+03,DUF3449/PF11931.3/70,DUF3449/PF11931.3/1.4e-65,zf-C2H2_jaz/PF12171.3/3.3e+03,zf-C2H2_jaz/PF12171.3/2.5e-07,zf-C2H2_jaz/PF12171.3/1.6e+03,zf-C2H2_jaz/PF12171.3/2.2e+02,zf-met/PF12874.2/1.3e+04,zf-met/PF12874.2/8.3e+03,zf-met/PF12874.2/1.4e-06,zf-met/PF12
MSSTLLERSRQHHEDVERLCQKIMKDLRTQPKTHKESILQDHRTNNTLNQISEISHTLQEIYLDKDGSRKKEIEDMSGAGTIVFSHFYDKLKEMKDYHRKFTSDMVITPEGSYNDRIVLDMLADATSNVQRKKFSEADLDVKVHFTGEEGFGRFLDLHEHFSRFLNLRPVKQRADKPDYIGYLETFTRFADYPRDLKLDAEYKLYLEPLFKYLLGFLQRVQPLTDTNKALAKSNKDFADKYAAGRIEGWEDLENNSLYCKFCDKIFAKDTVFEKHLEGKKHLKNKESYDEKAERKFQQRRTTEREIAQLENHIRRLAELLVDQVENTRINLEKKLTKTWEEIEMELDAQEREARGEVTNDTVEDDGVDEDEEVIYNPLKLPLGWDGKPIPYWLYKLHGLNIEYKCEICGDESYFGPLVFERHFREWKHAAGMRRLRIPNTRHFKFVTSIADAKALYERIKRDTELEGAHPELDEECEDIHGNVYTRKLFEELKGQGLLK